MRAEPPWTSAITVDLPLPPSVNQFVAKLGNKSPAVQAWIKQADKTMLLAGRLPGPIKGDFLAKVLWAADEFGRSDIDNRIKPLLDYLQRIGLISDDRRCLRLDIQFDDLRHKSCRVMLCPVEATLRTGKPPWE